MVILADLNITKSLDFNIMKPYDKYMMMMEEAVRDNRRRAKTERIVRQAYTKERETVRHTDKMVQLAPILFDVMVEESAKQE